ncbi:MAG: hypothetical protein RJA70_4138 [Pseudomonadota bacterium]|jgi:hypothetical protein
MSTSALALSIRKTPVGKGVFAKTRFRKSQAIGPVRGKVLSADEDYDEDYAMDFGKNTVLEPSAPFRFLNHCCEPNAELVEVESGDPKIPSTMWVYATKTIRPGDQVTIDYSWPEFAAIRCKCGAATCRGWVVDAGQLKRLLKREAQALRKASVAKKSNSRKPAAAKPAAAKPAAAKPAAAKPAAAKPARKPRADAIEKPVGVAKPRTLSANDRGGRARRTKTAAAAPTLKKPPAPRRAAR